MPNKYEFFDYEPVTGPRARDASTDASEVDWRRSDISVSKAGTRTSTPPLVGDRDWPSRTPKTDRTKPVKEETKSAEQPAATLRGQWLRRRGHAISYAGLFLFTLVLYFRPYELASWLSWTTSSAFWIAIATITFYIPIQLGLDGKITVRPREVNMVLLLLLIGPLSMPLALEPGTAFFAYIDYIKVVLMFIVLVNVCRTEKRVKGLMLIGLLVGCVLSISAINDYRIGRFVLGLHERIQGLIGNLFDNPNDLALHLVTMIPLAIGLGLSSRGVIKKLLFGAVTVLMICGVVVTFSRGGFVGMAAAGGVLAWRIAQRNKWLVAMVLPPAVLFFVLLSPGGYGSRLSMTTDDSSSARISELKRSLYIAARHPLVGVGMGNYVIFSNTDHTVHNAYLLVATELGFPAMFFYVIFLITPMRELRRIERETSANRRSSRFYYMAVGLEASIIGYMVSSFFAPVAFLWYAYYIVGYAICLRNLYAASAERVPAS